MELEISLDHYSMSTTYSDRLGLMYTPGDNLSISHML